MPEIKLPKIKHRKSGLRKIKKNWAVLYYKDGRLLTWNTKTTNLSDALAERDWFHEDQLAQGATYMGTKPALLAAIKAVADNDEESMACIYEVTNYKVIIDGVQVITTKDLEKAITSRNQYIKENY